MPPAPFPASGKRERRLSASARHTDGIPPVPLGSLRPTRNCKTLLRTPAPSAESGLPIFRPLEQAGVSESDVHSDRPQEDQQNHNRGKETDDDRPEGNQRKTVIARCLVHGFAAKSGKQGNQIHIGRALGGTEPQFAGGLPRRPDPADEETDHHSANRQHPVGCQIVQHIKETSGHMFRAEESPDQRFHRGNVLPVRHAHRGEESEETLLIFPRKAVPVDDLVDQRSVGRLVHERPDDEDGDEGVTENPLG